MNANLQDTIDQLVAAGSAILAARLVREEEEDQRRAERTARELAEKWAGRMTLLRERLPGWMHAYIVAPNCEPENVMSGYAYDSITLYAGIKLALPKLAPIMAYVVDRQVAFVPCQPVLDFDDEEDAWLARYEEIVYRKLHELTWLDPELAVAVHTAHGHAADYASMVLEAQTRNAQPKQLPAPDPARYALDQATQALDQGTYAEAQALALVAMAHQLSSILAALKGQQC